MTMHERVRIHLEPLGEIFEVDRGTPLKDFLFDHGVEFPCGGLGICSGCKVRVLAGSLPVTTEQEEMLTPAELRDGWRLACSCGADEDLTLELAQWEAPVLTDETPFQFTPREGLGVAVDLGTTTIAAQLLDLRTGQVLAVQTALNEQARYGADIMNRVLFAMNEGEASTLASLIRKQIGEMIAGLIFPAKPVRRTDRLRADVVNVVIVGNTAMHHLFCGIDIEPLSHYPFDALNDGLQLFLSRDLDWGIPGDPPVRFLPCIGGFVGSDILAGVMAVRMHESEPLISLVDLGTNGEIVIGNRQKMLCASTAAGPAFEGARIGMGMRAATGAISEVKISGEKFRCHVLGNVQPRGICGSGLVDAAASALDLGLIAESGRLANGGAPISLCPPVVISQADIRELQLAKGAIATGFRILLNRLGATPEDISRLHLAGAFGNYINIYSARRIGLLTLPPSRIHPAGNTALLGAKLALFMPDDEAFSRVARTITHIPLSADLEFQELFAGEMRFPSASPSGF